MTDKEADPNWITASLGRMQTALSARSEPFAMSERPENSRIACVTHAQLSALGVQKRHFGLISNPEKRLLTTSLRAATQFVVDEDAWCLLLTGDSGVGKTFAAEWALTEILRRSAPPMRIPRRPQVYTVPALRRAWFDEKLMIGLGTAQALLLDDLGSEPRDPLGFTGASLFEVVNTRWGKGAKTILTTNLTPAAFKQRYGHEVTDRILHGGRAVIVLGSSLRREAQ